MQANRKWLVLFAVCLLVFLANYQQFQISALAARVLPELGLTTTQFSGILFAPMLFAIFFGIPLGVIADRWGSRVLITIAVLVSAVASACRIVCTGFAELLVASMLMGAAPAALNSNVIKVLGSWFGVRTDFAMGWYFASSSAGIALSLATSSMFPSTAMAYAVPAIVMAFGALAWFVVGRDHVDRHVVSDVGEMMCCFKHAAGCRFVWIIAFNLGLGMAAAEAFSGFLPLVLDEAVGMSAAGWLTSLVTVGSIVGCIAAPLVRTLFSSYRTFLLIASALGTISMTVTCATFDSPQAALLFATGALTAVCGPTIQGLPYQIPAIGERYAGSAGGIINTVSLLLTYLLPLGISAVSGTDFALFMGLVIGCFALTMVLVPLLPSPRTLHGGDS